MPALKKDRLDDAWSPSETVDPAEVARFEALAEQWWNPQGVFRPVHAFNAIRCDYIIDVIARHFDRASRGQPDLRGLRIVDVGCGAGLLCEPLADLGAAVVGIDAAARNIAITPRKPDAGSTIVISSHGISPKRVSALTSCSTRK